MGVRGGIDHSCLEYGVSSSAVQPMDSRSECDGRTSDGAVISMTAAPEAPSAATKLAASASPPVTVGH